MNKSYDLLTALMIDTNFFLKSDLKTYVPAW